MYVKPTHDHVPDPARDDYLPPEGRHVEDGIYWWRRVSDGDVVETDPPPTDNKAPDATTSESPPPAGSSVSEAPKTTARKGAQA